MTWWRRVLALVRRKKDAQMNEEIEQHLADLTARNLAEGMSPRRHVTLLCANSVEWNKSKKRPARNAS